MLEHINSKIKKLFSAGFFHIFGSTVINKVLVFLSATVIVRILSKAEYGVFSYSWNAFSLILLFSGFGIEAGSLQILSECKDDEPRYLGVLSYSIRFGCIFNLFLSVVIIGIGLFIPFPFEGSGILLVLLCLLPELTVFYNLQTIYLRTLKKNRSFSALSLTNTFFVSLLTVLGAFVFSARGLIAGRYIGYIVSIIIGLVILRIPLSFKYSQTISPLDKKDLLKISSIGLVNNGLSQLMYLLDVFVIGIVLVSETNVASYKVATQIPNALTFIPGAVVTFIYPYFAEHRNEKKICMHRYKQVIIAMAGLNFIISTSLFLFAPIILHVFFGSQYYDAVTSFRILVISYFFSGTFRVISGNLLATQRKYSFQLFVAIFSGVTNIVADYCLVSGYGMNGAAIATLIVTILTSFLNTFYLIRVFISDGIISV